MFYLTMYSTHLLYSYMTSDIIIMIMYYSDSERGNQLPPLHWPLFRIAARNILYAPTQGKDSIYQSLLYTSCGILGGMRNISMASQSIALCLSRTEELAKAATCARNRRPLQQPALNVHVKHSDLT